MLLADKSSAPELSCAFSGQMIAHRSCQKDLYARHDPRRRRLYSNVRTSKSLYVAKDSGIIDDDIGFQMPSDRKVTL